MDDRHRESGVARGDTRRTREGIAAAVTPGSANNGGRWQLLQLVLLFISKGQQSESQNCRASVGSRQPAEGSKKNIANFEWRIAK